MEIIILLVVYKHVIFVCSFYQQKRIGFTKEIFLVEFLTLKGQGYNLFALGKLLSAQQYSGLVGLLATPGRRYFLFKVYTRKIISNNVLKVNN